MGKLPWMMFYPNDWARDLEDHPAEIEGFWIRIICKLWYAENQGRMTRTLDQWARILRCSKMKANEVLLYFQSEKIGDVTFSNQNVTVISRRIFRDAKLREANRLKVKRHREKVGCNQNETDLKPESNRKKSEVIGQKSELIKDKGFKSISSNPEKPDLKECEKIYKAYPRKVGKGAALKAIQNAVKRLEVLVDKEQIDNAETFLAGKVQAFASSPKGQAGQFCPHPATWFNQERYFDDPAEWQDRGGQQAQGQAGGIPRVDTATPEQRRKGGQFINAHGATIYLNPKREGERVRDDDTHESIMEEYGGYTKAYYENLIENFTKAGMKIPIFTAVKARATGAEVRDEQITE